MSTVIDQTRAGADECSWPAAANKPTASTWREILAQAMTVEMIAAMNYSEFADICDDPDEIADALDHSESNWKHAARFAAEGRELGVAVLANLHAKPWQHLRDTFQRCIAGRDFTACLLQEIMLESFAVWNYARLAKVAPGPLAMTFSAIAAEKEVHIAHALAVLKNERARHPQSFDDQADLLHLDVTATLAEITRAWMAKLPA